MACVGYLYDLVVFAGWSTSPPPPPSNHSASSTHHHYPSCRPSVHPAPFATPAPVRAPSVTATPCSVNPASGTKKT